MQNVQRHVSLFRSDKFFMMQNDRNARMTLLSLAFIALINYPLLSMFDKASLWLGSARLFVYFFIVWLLLIVLTARAATRR